MSSGEKLAFQRLLAKKVRERFGVTRLQAWLIVSQVTARACSADGMFSAVSRLRRF